MSWLALTSSKGIIYPTVFGDFLHNLHHPLLHDTTTLQLNRLIKRVRRRKGSLERSRICISRPTSKLRSQQKIIRAHCISRVVLEGVHHRVITDIKRVKGKKTDGQLGGGGKKDNLELMNVVEPTAHSEPVSIDTEIINQCKKKSKQPPQIQNFKLHLSPTPTPAVIQLVQFPYVLGRKSLISSASPDENPESVPPPPLLLGPAPGRPIRLLDNAEFPLEGSFVGRIVTFA